MAAAAMPAGRTVGGAVTVEPAAATGDVFCGATAGEVGGAAGGAAGGADAADALGAADAAEPEAEPEAEPGAEPGARDGADAPDAAGPTTSTTGAGARTS